MLDNLASTLSDSTASLADTLVKEPKRQDPPPALPNYDIPIAIATIVIIVVTGAVYILLMALRRNRQGAIQLPASIG